MSAAVGVQHRVNGIVFDGRTNDLWVAFRVDGGSSTATFVTQAVASAFLGSVFPRYGSGQGRMATVLLRVDPASGVVERGTFLISRNTEGTTNDFQVTGLRVADGKLYLSAKAGQQPPAAGASAVEFVPLQDVNPLDSLVPLRLQLPLDLTTLERVERRQ